jgi:hypothetical protein
VFTKTCTDIHESLSCIGECLRSCLQRNTQPRQVRLNSIKSLEDVHHRFAVAYPIVQMIEEANDNDVCDAANNDAMDVDETVDADTLTGSMAHLGLDI